MVNILLGGDVCPMGKIQNAFIEGNENEIFHDLIDEIAGSDLAVVNLECPLISHKTPIVKEAILGANIKCIQGFVAAKWKVLNLANNHSYDHGVRGLKETIKTIKDAGLSVVGAGLNIEEAKAPLIKEVNSERIIIYSMAEREFSIADEQTAGANPLDLINCVDAIRLYKKDGIFIVLIHGGKEHYSYPSPEMVRRCRFIVDMGADAVICCHSHCPLPWEIYANKPIVYGLGNLVFEPFKPQLDNWYQGYLAKLKVADRQINLEIIPYLQSKEFSGARKMDAITQKRFLEDMLHKSTELKSRKLLEERWASHCQNQKDAYLAGLFGYNRIMYKIRKILFKTLYSKNEILRALLLTQCETHQEVLNKIFRDLRSGK